MLEGATHQRLDGDPPEGSFKYASVVGMLLYLSGHSRPDIAYSVSQVARFTFAPKRQSRASPETHRAVLDEHTRQGTGTQSLKRIERRRVPRCRLRWAVRLQKQPRPGLREKQNRIRHQRGKLPCSLEEFSSDGNRHLHNEAEVIAMSSCCRELMPILDMVDEVGEAVGLSQSDAPKMHVCIHEDNAGALILAETLLPQATSRSSTMQSKLIGSENTLVCVEFPWSKLRRPRNSAIFSRNVCLLKGMS